MISQELWDKWNTAFPDAWESFKEMVRTADANRDTIVLTYDSIHFSPENLLKTQLSGSWRNWNTSNWITEKTKTPEQRIAEIDEQIQMLQQNRQDVVDGNWKPEGW